MGGGAGPAGDPLRSATPSRRGREGSDVHGSGTSPKAKRAGSHTDPIVQQAPVLTAKGQSAAVYTLNARMDAAQLCSETIVVAVHDDATQVEAAAREISVARVHD